MVPQQCLNSEYRLTNNIVMRRRGVPRRGVPNRVVPNIRPSNNFKHVNRTPANKTNNITNTDNFKDVNRTSANKPNNITNPDVNCTINNINVRPAYGSNISAVANGNTGVNSPVRSTCVTAAISSQTALGITCTTAANIGAAATAANIGATAVVDSIITSVASSPCNYTCGTSTNDTNLGKCCSHDLQAPQQQLQDPSQYELRNPSQPSQYQLQNPSQHSAFQASGRMIENSYTSCDDQNNSTHGASESFQGAPESIEGAPESFQGAPESFQGAQESFQGVPESFQGASDLSYSTQGTLLPMEFREANKYWTSAARHAIRPKPRRWVIIFFYASESFG